MLVERPLTYITSPSMLVAMLGFYDKVFELNYILSTLLP